MAMPKKKMTSTRSGNRRGHIALSRPSLAICSHCKKPIRPHTVCRYCGYYKAIKIAS